jgi:hypothetical protein
MNGSKVTIVAARIIEFPSEDSTFVDGDNDAIYFTNGDLSVTNSASVSLRTTASIPAQRRGDNPFTAAADVTPYLSQNNWYEGTYHEGKFPLGHAQCDVCRCVFSTAARGWRTATVPAARVMGQTR